MNLWFGYLRFVPLRFPRSIHIVRNFSAITHSLQQSEKQVIKLGTKINDAISVVGNAIFLYWLIFTRERGGDFYLLGNTSSLKKINVLKQYALLNIVFNNVTIRVIV